jgi:hypothetical protein
METPGAAWAVILSNPELRQGLIREATRARRSGRAASRGPALRRLFAHALHGLAFRVDPISRTPDLRPAPAQSE